MTDTQNPQPEVQQVLQPYGIGIDTHSKFIAVCVLVRQPTAVERHEKEFNTDWPGLVAAHCWARGVLEASKLAIKVAELRYCIESTGTYHLPVLKAWGGIPTVVNPMLAAPTRRKTDVLDARLLAHHSITGMWPASFIPTDQAQVLRVLWAQRRDSVRLATRISNRINNIILRFGHTIGSKHAMRTSVAEGLITDMVEGKVPKSKLVAPDGLPEGVRPVIARLLSDMHEATQEAKKTTRAAVEYVNQNTWPAGGTTIPGKALLSLLQTVPGVGVGTSLAWLSEVCDPSRFQHAKQVAAYCGCDPSLKTSAGKVTSFVRRSGNSKLHFALLYAAGSLLRTKGEQIGQWAASIAGRHKKGGYRKALGAAARRVALGLWHVHRTATEFSYEKYNLSSRPGVAEVPLAVMLPAFSAKILKLHGYKTSKQVAEDYYKGKLSKIDGFGAGSMNHVKTWIDANTIRPEKPTLTVPQQTHDGKKVYHVDMSDKTGAFPKQRANRRSLGLRKPEVDEEELQAWVNKHKGDAP